VRADRPVPRVSSVLRNWTWLGAVRKMPNR